nr:phosphatidylglycerophosphatase A [uncultured Dethiosulfovibrio sp.]
MTAGDRRGLKRSIATLAGLGNLSSMPGTLVSSIACFAILPFCSTSTLAVAISLTFPLGVWACDGKPDGAVIDHVTGVWVAMIGHVTPLSLGFAVPSLFLFRVFGLVKPFPVSMAGKLPGGLGVMADDVVAGIVANFILWGIRWMFMGQIPSFLSVI